MTESNRNHRLIRSRLPPNLVLAGDVDAIAWSEVAPGAAEPCALLTRDGSVADRGGAPTRPARKGRTPH
jgi:hypothetical protein